MASKTKAQKISVDEARKEIAGGNAVAVDVRSEEEWSEGHAPGAVHLPDANAEDAPDRPQDGARLVVFAKDGKAAAEAASHLADEGYDAVAVDGDMEDWADEDYNIQPTQDPDEETELGAG